MSQYFTIYDLQDGTSKYQTISAFSTPGLSAQINSRRIMISMTQPSTMATVHIAFGTNPTADANSFVLPAGATIFNFTPGWKVSAYASVGVKLSIVDLD